MRSTPVAPTLVAAVATAAMSGAHLSQSRSYLVGRALRRISVEVLRHLIRVLFQPFLHRMEFNAAIISRYSHHVTLYRHLVFPRLISSNDCRDYRQTQRKLEGARTVVGARARQKAEDLRAEEQAAHACPVFRCRMTNWCTEHNRRFSLRSRGIPPPPLAATLATPSPKAKNESGRDRPGHQSCERY